MFGLFLENSVIMNLVRQLNNLLEVKCTRKSMHTSDKQKSIAKSQEQKTSQIVVVQTNKGNEVEINIQLAKLAMQRALEKCES